LSGVLVVAGIKVFDKWSFGLVRRFFSGTRDKKQVAADILIIITVAAVLIFVGIFEAVGIGVLISLCLFVYRMGKEIIRRNYTAERIRSNVHRSPKEFKILEKKGSRIRILELEGTLFFGTADKLAGLVENFDTADTEILILDLSRLSDIDSTGANMLFQIKERCLKKEISLALSALGEDDNNRHFLKSIGILEKLGTQNIFTQTEIALAWAEDSLLEKELGKNRYDTAIPLKGVDAFSELSPSELEHLETYLETRDYTDGEIIFSQGSEADGMYALSRGRAHIIIHLDTDETRRIGSLCPGSIFGEMAILDGKSRSATLIAEGEISCRFLALEKLEQIKKESPPLAHRLLSGLALELSKRIRLANRIATELKQ
jgi:SulP family sulfate permease